MLFNIRRLNWKQKLAIAFILSAIAAGLTVWGPASIIFERFENRVLDYMLLFRGARPANELPILIVLIEDESAKEYGFRSPTPRALLADVVNRLNRMGAGCIGLDFFLDRPHVPEQDDPLEAALANSNPPVVLVHPAMERFAKHATISYSQVSEGSAGVVRHMRVSSPPESMPSFVGAVFKQCVGQYPPIPEGVDPDNVILNLYGPPSHITDSEPIFSVVTAKDLKVLPDVLVKGKIVLVGSGFDDLGDTFLTSFSSAQEGFKISFGVELHAVVLGMILENRFIIPIAGMILALMAVVFYFITGISTFFLGTLRTFLIGIVQLIAWIAVAGYAFVSEGVLIPVFTPVLFAVIIFLICQTMHFLTEARYTRFLRSTFNQYISPDVVGEMVDHGWGLDLGGESKTLSIFFSDLQGFTTISEKLNPNELVDFLNEYLGVMTDILFDEKGTLDKFEGDAVMAFWGAPLDMPDHADRTCRTALKMQRAMIPLNEGWASRNLPQLIVRIGIHTGEVVIGNIGSEKRRDFTIIGDAVNLASRLEGVNKPFETRVIVSEDTLAMTNSGFLTRELGKIVVKGKTQPVTIFELLGEASEPPEHFDDQKDKFEKYAKGLELFHVGNFTDARDCFQENATQHDDGASRFMAQQCDELIADPPEGQWSGAVVLTSK